MQIELNGQNHLLTDVATDITTVAALVASLGYAGKRVAVECNGEIVPRSRYAETVLHERDRVEIVVAVGGG